MARRCDLTGIGPQTGHKVSHSNIKTKKRFLPNLQEVSLISDALNAKVRVRVTVATLRSVEHNGGLDAFLIKHANKDLTPKAQRLKRQIKKKLQAQAA
jgi:large subunit ribosomal protein L28